MINIKLSTPFPKIPIARQTPGGTGVWGDCKFFIDEPVEKADWWVVLDGLTSPEQTIIPKKNSILITAETEFTKKYNEKFLNQFGTIITSQQIIKHPRVINTQQGHLWHVGWFGTGSGVDPKDYKKVFTTYDQLKAIDITKLKKDKLISIVISSKNRTEGQKKRLEFISKIKAHFGDKLDLFGVGFHMIRDKWEGLAPYKYHLIIENSYAPHWWTEKIADAYLAGAYPIHYGCPNIYDYFSTNAVSKIDIDDVPGTIATIEKIIAEDYQSNRIEEILKARDQIMNKYNLFPMIADLVKKIPTEGTPSLVTIKPEKKPWLKKKIVEILKNKGILYTLPRDLYRKYRKMMYGSSN